MKKEVQIKDRQRKLSFEKCENPMKQLDTQRILTVRKMNQNEKSNKDISNEINDYFDSPEKYFQKNSPVSIGKKIYILDMNDPKLRRAGRLKTERKITKNYFNHLVSLASKMSSKSNNAFNKSNKNIGNEKQKFLDRFEVIDNYKLKKIFDSYKIKGREKDDSVDRNQISNSSFTDSDTNKDENNTKNKLINSNYFVEDIPNDIQKSLSNQNKKLQMRRMLEKKNKILSQYLSKKVNKPQNNLLLNKIDLYRFKKEVINEIENRKPLDEKARLFQRSQRLIY